MSADPDREFLDRATIAIDRVTAVLERQEVAFERHQRDSGMVFRRMDERDALAAERHTQLMREHHRVLDRFARSEDRVVEALNDLHLEVGRNSTRLDDMQEALRANTQAVLSMLDRLGPAPG